MTKFKRERMTAEITANASLLSIPSELRLMVYAHLAKPVTYHVDHFRKYPKDIRSVDISHKRICRAVDAEHVLCTKPVFSGLHPLGQLCHTVPESVEKEEEKESHSHHHHHHHLAIRRTCRLIYSETKGILDREWMGIIVPHDWMAWKLLSSMSTHQLETITDLTIQLLPCKQGRGAGIAKIVYYLEHHAAEFPNLRTIAVQAVQPYRKFCVLQDDGQQIFDPLRTWRKLWFLNTLQSAFQGRGVVVMLEAWVLIRATNIHIGCGNEEMVRIRGTIKQHFLHQPEETSFEMQKHRVLGQGPWMQHWDGQGLGYIRYVWMSPPSLLDL